MTSTTKTLTGGCHCGAVRFEVTTDLASGIGRCNCSICQRLGGANVIVKPDAFRLLAGESELGTYEWGAKISRRRFCKTCGVHTFGAGHLAEVGGDYVSVNLNCVDDIEVHALPVSYWDGRHDNWMSGPRDTPWPIGPSV